ncbi:MAG: hypothetical protein Q8P59_07115 [Dehalococcoidia bacterium]|nr:hypothetical protein [Dehalococcoidia bacterium]
MTAHSIVFWILAPGLRRGRLRWNDTAIPHQAPFQNGSRPAKGGHSPGLVPRRELRGASLHYRSGCYDINRVLYG